MVKGFGEELPAENPESIAYELSGDFDTDAKRLLAILGNEGIQVDKLPADRKQIIVLNLLRGLVGPYEEMAKNSPKYAASNLQTSAKLEALKKFLAHY